MTNTGSPSTIVIARAVFAQAPKAPNAPTQLGIDGLGPCRKGGRAAGWGGETGRRPVPPTRRRRSRARLEPCRRVPVAARRFGWVASPLAAARADSLAL